MSTFSPRPPAKCDNCGEPCATYRQDSTLICGSKLDKVGEWNFRWGVECSCGKRRGWIARPPSREASVPTRDLPTLAATMRARAVALKPQPIAAARATREASQ